MNCGEKYNALYRQIEENRAIGHRNGKSKKEIKTNVSDSMSHSLRALYFSYLFLCSSQAYSQFMIYCKTLRNLWGKI